MRRISCRVREQEEREQKRVKLLREKQQEELTLFYSQLSTALLEFPASCDSSDEQESSEIGQIINFDLPLSIKQKYYKKSLENSATHKMDVDDEEEEEDDDDGRKPAYRRLKQNLYRPPIMRPNFAIEESPPCMCVDECDHNCQNRLLNMECIRSQCPVVARIVGSRSDGVNQNSIYCKNMCLQSKAFIPTEVFSTAQCGYGLRILQPAPANSIIIEYLGEVITSTECKERMSDYTAGDDFYFASLGSGLFLDAKMMGSDARYSNHSCDPNCELQKWTVMDESRIALVSKCDLPAGTEITYNYQYFADDFEGSAHMKRQTCKCGAENCAGTIGGKVKPSLVNSVRMKAETMLNGGSKRQTRQALEALLESVKENIPNLDECQALQGRIIEILQHASDWTLQYESTVGNNKAEGVLVDQATARQLLETAPTIIHLEQVSALEAQLKKVEKVERKLQNLSHNYNSSKSNERSQDVLAADTETIEGDKLAPLDEQGEIRLSWDDFLTLCKDVLTTLPIRCNYVGLLIRAYYELNAWCRQWLLPIVPEAVQKQFEKPPSLSSCAVVDRLIAAYMHTIDGQFFEMVRTNYVYILSQCFEMRLNDFIVRRSLEKLAPNIQSAKKYIGSSNGSLEGPVDGAVHSTVTRFICERADVFPTAISEALKSIGDEGLAPKQKPAKAKQSKRGSSQESDDLLYCICRQSVSNFSRCDYEALNASSSSSSQSVGKLLMMQCEVCEDWYHPMCIQAMDALSTNGVTAKRERERFSHCPVCAYVTRNDMTAFAYKSKLPLECVDFGTSTSNSSSGLGNGKKKSNAGNSNNDSLRFMTDSFIKSITEVEKSPQISRSPVSLLLNLCLTYIDEWKQRAANLFNQPSVQVILDARLQDDASIEDVVLEGRLLLECLKLQAEVLLLHLLTTREDVSRLQEVIWTLSVRPIFRAVRIGDNQYIRRHRPPLMKIKAAVSCGECLVKRSQSYTMTALQGLKSLVGMAADVKSVAIRCVSRDQAMGIDERLKYLCRFVAIENEYYYAIVKSFLRPIKIPYPENSYNALDSRKDTVGEAVVEIHGGSDILTEQVELTHSNVTVVQPILVEEEAVVEAAENSEEEEASSCYCWCQRADDGSPMICCDSCSEWFHIRCVGVGRKDPVLSGQQSAVFLCISCSISRKSTYKFAW